MTNPIEFEKLRSRVATAQHELYTAVFSTQNLQVPEDVETYTASVLGAHVKVRAAERALLQFLRHLKT